MLLRHSPTSPFVRKVTVTAAELGLAERIAWKSTNPWDPNDDLPNDNPMGKVPALILDNGETLYDSGVICEYLDSLHHGEKLFPAEGERRWQALRLHALADGILEAAVARLIERSRRPSELYWADWDTRQAEKVTRVLDMLEHNEDVLEERLTIAQITVGCALGYLDFRFPDEDWRAARPKLAAWFETFSKRPSMQATVPKAA
jgi:glutathione S-transferase